MTDSNVERSTADPQLVTAVRSGSAAAFDVLVDRYYADIMAYLTRLLGSREAADEVAQEAFFDAYRLLHQLSDDQSFSAWLHRIAHYRATRVLRRRAVLHFVSFEQLAGTLGAWLGRRPAHPQDDVPTRQAVQAALDTLPVGERQALLLHGLAGFSAREIADMLGISPDAAARRVSRGSQRFRDQYRHSDDADGPTRDDAQEPGNEADGRDGQR